MKVEQLSCCYPPWGKDRLVYYWIVAIHRALGLKTNKQKLVQGIPHLATLADGIILSNSVLMRKRFYEVISALCDSLTLCPEFMYDVDLVFRGEYE